ncbi:hypothetical protein DYB28_001679 [Aphanomyces astaci]|uniref:Choline transporter-like protein n=1 Tax=Aphanomyces astaci TaxID=112090 RepID=A0A9X8HGD8_APHAT|nr:hypothetical protein DYB28_001679 [Aphanomyces astaci]
MTTSFGSICMGSLLVAILEALESMAKEARKKGNGAACVAECILNMLRGILEYINRWAFVYVGMYGFPFAHAGKAVYGLFQTRGLSAIVNDDLIGAAMGSLSLACVILPLVGLAFGVGVTVIPLSVVSSAVTTVFVCFAEVAY